MLVCVCDRERRLSDTARITFQNIYNGYFNGKCRYSIGKWKARHRNGSNSQKWEV